MTRPVAEAVDDGKCFACGEANPHGLGLRFAREPGGTARATVTLDARYQGFRGIAHGGIVMMLLDEAMAHAVGATGELGVTAHVAVRFRGRVPLGEPVEAHGRVVSKRGRVYRLEATVGLPDGTVLASAEGSFMSVGPVDPARLSNPGARPIV